MQTTPIEPVNVDPNVGRLQGAEPSAPKRVQRSKNESQIMKDKIAARNACKKQMKERYKSVDLFGQGVSLTWNGEDTYKTAIGATLSWAILAVMAAYSIYRLYYMITLQNPTISKTSLIKTLEEDVPWKPQDTGFDFAFGLNSPIDPSYGFFTAKYI